LNADNETLFKNVTNKDYIKNIHDGTNKDDNVLNTMYDKLRTMEKEEEEYNYISK